MININIIDSENLLAVNNMVKSVKLVEETLSYYNDIVDSSSVPAEISRGNIFHGMSLTNNAVYEWGKNKVNTSSRMLLISNNRQQTITGTKKTTEIVTVENWF